MNGNPKPRKVLFVCLGNSCRSQMAEAIARHEASEFIEASSAGLVPLGFIAAPTLAVLAENGICAQGQTSKGVTRNLLETSDLVVNMIGRPLPSSLLAGIAIPVENWDVKDPYGEDPAIYRSICEDIQRRVAALAQRIRNESSRK